MKPAEAAALMGPDVNAQFVRLLIQQGKVPWGYCVKGRTGRFTYFINEKKFYETEGIKPDGKKEG